MKQETEKKTTPKKTAVKKTAAKKTTVKKVSTASKTTAPKKKIQQTSIVAYVDVGFGNTLYIRGEGAGLSWEKGLPLKNISAAEWVFNTSKATDLLTFKFLINDQIWAEGDNFVAEAGTKSVSSPKFGW